jgi:hypothetical protein
MPTDPRAIVSDVASQSSGICIRWVPTGSRNIAASAVTGTDARQTTPMPRAMIVAVPLRTWTTPLLYEEAHFGWLRAGHDIYWPRPGEVAERLKAPAC